MIRLLLIVLFIASIVMSNQAMAVVDDTPVFVNGGTLAISSIPATSGTAAVSVTNFPSVQTVNGTQAISNFPSVQYVAGTMALSSGASTAAKQDTTISQLGTIANALVLGTIQISPGSKYVTQTYAAVSGAHSLILSFGGQGVSEVSFDAYDPDSCITLITGIIQCNPTDKQFRFLGSIDGVAYRQIYCSPSDLVDDQLYGNSDDVFTTQPDGHFRCDAAGWNYIAVITDNSAKRGVINISASTGSSIIQQVQSPVLVRPMSGSTLFSVHENGVNTVTGTLGLTGGTIGISGVVNTNGTIVQGTGGSSAWLTTSVLGTLTKVSTVDTITNAVTVNSHAITNAAFGVTNGTLTTVQSGTLNVVAAVTAITNALPAGSNTIGKVDQGVAGTSPWQMSLAGGTLSTINGGTLAASQSGIWTVQPGNTANTTPWLSTISGGTLTTIQSGTLFANVITGQSGVAGGGGTLTANVQRVVPSLSSTYMAATQPWTPGATPTALLKFQGSQTTTAKLKYLDISCTQTTAGINNFFLIKRSTATIGGTFATATAVPLDSASPSATAVFGWYTANNNGTLGAVVGTMGVASILCPAPAGTANDRYRFDFTNSVMEPLVVRGTTQMVELNFNGAALPAGLSIKAQAVWTEE